MNEVIKSIRERRSIRSFLNKPVEKEKIEQIIECAKSAPTAKNSQSWNFIVVTNKEVIRKVGELAVKVASAENPTAAKMAISSADTILYNAPLFIAVTEPIDYHWGKEDAAIATQNMVLASHSLGLGSCYIGKTRQLKDNKEFNTLLDVAEGHRVVISLIIGYPVTIPKMPPRKEVCVSWIE